MDNPLWEWLARTRTNAYHANAMWQGPSSCSAGPMWCFERFGQSSTELPDGRIIHIAGEHEDHYDPDFAIYNDVVVMQPGGTVSIFGYPREVFPPTDFHTATLVPGRIVLVGSLGYPKDRIPGATQVLELSLDTMAVQRIETHGDAPGWISDHRATLSAAGDAIVVNGGQVFTGAADPLWENIDTWELDLSRWTWARRTRRGWPQWTYMRADRRPSHLWQMRHALWLREANWRDEFAKDMQRLVSAIGFEPDLDLVRTLYCPDASAIEQPPSGEEPDIVRVFIGGVTVKFKEDHSSIEALVEGQLPPATLEALQRSVLERLSRLHGTAWTVQARN